jgi:hypothetical protein
MVFGIDVHQKMKEVRLQMTARRPRMAMAASASGCVLIIARVG